MIVGDGSMYTDGFEPELSNSVRSWSVSPG